MKKEKSFIKIILSNWYVLKASSDLSVIDLLIPIEQCLDKLTHNGELKQTDLLILSAYRDGYNFEEIAKIVKMTRQTVSNRIDSIVSRLETLLVRLLVGSQFLHLQSEGQACKSLHSETSSSYLDQGE